MISVENASYALAASIVDRSHDLIEDGWVKGRLSTSIGGALRRFCILGAMQLAVEEVFGTDRYASVQAYDLAQAFILDEAANQYNYRSSSIPGFNDPANRTHDQVLSVLKSAAQRLWDLSLEVEDIGGAVDLSRYITEEVDTEHAKVYLNAVLA